MKLTSTGPTKVRSLKCCVLFDPSDGSIQHTHQVVTMENVKDPDDQMIETRAFELAKGLGVDVSQLKALHVDPNKLEEDREYKVDIRTGSLVPKGKDKPPQSEAL